MTSLNDYLARNGYASVEEWALDSDLHQGSDGVWRNEDGHETNIRHYLLSLLLEGRVQ